MPPMKLLGKLFAWRAASKVARRKSSRVTPAGSAALARGTRTGNGGLAALGLILLLWGRRRRRDRRGELVYRRRLKPGHALRIAVTTREGRVTELG